MTVLPYTQQAAFKPGEYGGTRNTANQNCQSQ
jgi:hypothetical protein